MDTTDSIPRSCSSTRDRTILGLILLPAGFLFVVNLAFAGPVFSDPLAVVSEKPALVFMGLWVLTAIACAAAFITVLCSPNKTLWLCLILCGVIGFSIIAVALNALTWLMLMSQGFA